MESEYLILIVSIIISIICFYLIGRYDGYHNGRISAFKECLEIFDNFRIKSEIKDKIIHQREDYKK